MEIKLKKGYFNFGDTLEPLYSSQSSFYNKATVFTIEDEKTLRDTYVLKSYKTLVAKLEYTGREKIGAYYWTNYALSISDINDITHITRRHLDEFLLQNCFCDGVTKLTRKQILSASQKPLIIKVCANIPFGVIFN